MVTIKSLLVAWLKSTSVHISISMTNALAGTHGLPFAEKSFSFSYSFCTNTSARAFFTLKYWPW